MTRVIKAGDIGETEKVIELEPLEEPGAVPEPVVVPAEPELVPA